MFPESYTIEDVPLQRDFIAVNCLPASAYMVLKYWDKFGSPGFTVYSYEEFLLFFPKTKRLGYPPGKLKEYLIKDDNFSEIIIEDKEANSILDLQYHIRNNRPIIVIYDNHYFHTQIESKNTHCSVMIGYTPENILVNDLFHGVSYALEQKRFIKAWELRHMRYILIMQPKQTLMSWIKT